MNEQEIERLVVRLTGDGSSFQRMMSQAATQSVQTASVVEAATRRVEAFQSGLKNVAGVVLSAFGAFGVVTSLRSAFERYAEIEQANIRLNAAIRANNRDVAEARGQYDALAVSITASTLTTRGDVMAMARYAETLGLTSDQSDRAIRNAVALAGAEGGEAEQWIRASAGAEQGNLHMLQRMLHLHNVRDETELLTKVNQRLNSGMAQAKEVAGSAGGRLQLLQKSLKGLSVEVGGLVAEVVMPVIAFLRQFIDWLKAAPPEVKKVVVWVIALSGALLALGPILSLLKPALAAFGFVLGFLNPILILKIGLFLTLTALWAAWKILIIVVTPLILACKVALWLFNAGLVATNVLLGMVMFGAAAALFSVIALALLAAAAAGIALYHAVRAVFSALSSTGALSGPISRIGGMLAGWWRILKDVVAVAQHDMPTAWKMLRDGFNLAINEVMDLWPPLWTFIQSGFSALWELAAVTFEARFTAAAITVSQRLAQMMPVVGDIFREENERLVAQVNDAAARVQAASLRLAEVRLRAAANAFRVEDSEATRAARQVVMINSVVAAVIAAIPSRNQGAALEAGGIVGRGMTQGIAHELQKVDATLIRSAEGISRVLAVLYPGTGGGLSAPAQAGRGTGAPSARRDELGGQPDRTTGFLRRIADAVERQAARPQIEVQGAGLQ